MKRKEYKPLLNRWPKIKKLLDENWRVTDIAVELKTSASNIYSYMKRNEYRRK